MGQSKKVIPEKWPKTGQNLKSQGSKKAIFDPKSPILALKLTSDELYHAHFSIIVGHKRFETNYIILLHLLRYHKLFLYTLLAKGFLSFLK